jgi:hypothetical protein
VEHGEQDLAVGAAFELVALREPAADGAEAVDLAVAHHSVSVQLKGLHPRLGEAHDGQAVEAQIAGFRLDDAGHVGPAGFRAVEKDAQLLRAQVLAGKTHDGTHKISTSGLLPSGQAAKGQKNAATS